MVGLGAERGAGGQSTGTTTGVHTPCTSAGREGRLPGETCGPPCSSLGGAAAYACGDTIRAAVSAVTCAWGTC